MSNSLDPDQARHFVGPDLGPNCLQRLSADDTGIQEKQGTSISANPHLILGPDIYLNDSKHVQSPSAEVDNPLCKTKLMSLQKSLSTFSIKNNLFVV